MKHRIVVLGAGYAGAYVAGNLARRLSPADTEITVVNAVPDFVERLRLHQLAAGQEIETQKLADVFAGTGIRLRLASVTAVDPERQAVAVADADGGGGGGGELGYDTLLYALGSRVTARGVPGVTEHAFDVAGRPSALRLRERLDSLSGRGEGGSVLIVGDGLTAGAAGPPSASAASTVSAVFRPMPGTSQISSTEALRSRLTEPKCFSSAFLRVSPRPGTASSGPFLIDCARLPRW